MGVAPEAVDDFRQAAVGRGMRGAEARCDVPVELVRARPSLAGRYLVEPEGEDGVRAMLHYFDDTQFPAGRET